jgi:RhoGAP domain
MGQAESSTAHQSGGIDTGLPVPSTALKSPVPDLVWLRLTEAMHYIESHGAYEHEGIYRVPGLGTKVAKMTAQLSVISPDEAMSAPLSASAGAAPLLDFASFGASLDDWASSIKQTFNRFAPLTGYNSYDPLCAAAATNSLPTLLTMVSALDPVSLERVEVVCRHLVRIALRSDKNKMSLSNLAKLWGSILVRPDESPATDLGRELKVAGRTFNFANLLLEAYYGQEVAALSAGTGDASPSAAIGVIPDGPPPLPIFRMRRSSFAADDVSALFSAANPSSPASGDRTSTAIPPAPSFSASTSPHSLTAAASVSAAMGGARRNIPALRLAPPSSPTSTSAGTSMQVEASVPAAADSSQAMPMPTPSSASGRSLQKRLSTALSARGSRLASPMVISKINADELADIIEAIATERSSGSFASGRSPMALKARQQNDARASNQQHFFGAAFTRHKRASKVKEEMEEENEEGEEEEEEEVRPPIRAGEKTEEDDLAAWEAATNGGTGSSSSSSSSSSPHAAAQAVSSAPVVPAPVAPPAAGKRPSFMAQLGSRLLLRRAASAASSKELMGTSSPAMAAVPSTRNVLTAAPSADGIGQGRVAGGRFDASALAAALSTVEAGSSTSSPDGGRPSLGSRPSIHSSPVFSSSSLSVEGFPGQQQPIRHVKVVVETRPSLAPGLSVVPSSSAIAAARSAAPSQQWKTIPHVADLSGIGKE